MRISRLLVRVCAAAAVFTVSSLAQEVTGSITGLVSDNSGAVISGAAVTATNVDTGAQVSTATDATGTYLFPLLRAGRYRIIVENPGFQRMQLDDIQVNTSERLRLDLTMKVGAVTETVTVTAATPLLQSERATIAT
jgi:hypothetical protein